MRARARGVDARRARDDDDAAAFTARADAGRERAKIARRRRIARSDVCDAAWSTKTSLYTGTCNVYRDAYTYVWDPRPRRHRKGSTKGVERRRESRRKASKGNDERRRKASKGDDGADRARRPRDTRDARARAHARARAIAKRARGGVFARAIDARGRVFEDIRGHH